MAKKFEARMDTVGCEIEGIKESVKKIPEIESTLVGLTKIVDKLSVWREQQQRNLKEIWETLVVISVERSLSQQSSTVSEEHEVSPQSKIEGAGEELQQVDKKVEVVIETETNRYSKIVDVSGLKKPFAQGSGGDGASMESGKQPRKRRETKDKIAEKSRGNQRKNVSISTRMKRRRDERNKNLRSMKREKVCRGRKKYHEEEKVLAKICGEGRMTM